MKINVYGMGYVGIVSAACWAKDGHDVLGIDIDHNKIETINSGKSTIIEPGLEDIIREVYQSKKLRAATSCSEYADVSVICVGTPSNENGSLKLNYISNVAEQLGKYIAKLDAYHVVNIRSTVLPGTIHDIVIPIIEKHAHKKAGTGFGICMNPEFLREGTSIEDFYNPPFTVIGEYDLKSGDVVSKLYKGLDAPLIRTEIKNAEMVKYACNTFHALKVTFANEFGNICKQVGVDSHEMMSIFSLDTKLNLSPYYLKPGFAFGGSCLPKDVRAILYKAKEVDTTVPVLSSILPSNIHQIEIALDMVKKYKKKKIGIFGLSFKANTDDLRESPMVEFVERLIGKGYEVSIYDKEVALAKIFGSNKKYIESVIPHISSLLKKTPLELIQNSEILVLSNKANMPEDLQTMIKRDQIVIDFVKCIDDSNKLEGTYDGICW